MDSEKIYQGIKAIVNSGNYEAAVWALEKMLESFPGHALAHNDLGVLFFNQGDKDRALTHYESAAGLQPENIIFQKNLADFYYVELGRIEEALKIYVNILSAHPKDIETLLITGSICVSLGKFEDAKVFLYRVLEIEPWNTNARELIEKLAEYEKTDLSMKPAEELYRDIQELIKGNDMANAKDKLEELLQVHPDYALAHNDLGVLYDNGGEMDRALEHFRKAVRLEPGNITFLKNLADLYYIELGQLEEALGIYVDILKAHPNDIEILVTIGHACVSLKKFEDARVFYQRALEIEPWNLHAREHLDKLAEYETAAFTQESPAQERGTMNSGDPDPAAD
jgi:Flp pilus assembly protein TadD